MLNTKELFNERELISAKHTYFITQQYSFDLGFKDRNACMNQKVITTSLLVLFKSKF